MPYTPTNWIDEVPATTPIKYKITDDTGGITNASAKIEVITGITAGTPLTAVNMNKIESALVADRAAIEAMLGNVYPVGCIYTTTIATNPATVFGFGTWAEFGAGKVLVGLDATQTEFNTVLGTGGEKTHALTTAEMPAHAHTQRIKNGSGIVDWILQGANLDPYQIVRFYAPIYAGTFANNAAPTTVQTAATGSGTAHNNLQPYITVYFFKRTA